MTAFRNICEPLRTSGGGAAAAGAPGTAAAAATGAAAAGAEAATSAGGFQSAGISCLKPMCRWFWCAASVK